VVNIATGTIILPVQSAKLVGAHITSGDPAQGAAIDGGNAGWTLLFDATTAEAAVWQFRMPVNWASGFTAKIQYTMATATADDVDFEVYVMAVSDGDSADVDTPSFATATSGTATVPGTAGYLDEISIDCSSNLDGLAAGDLVILRLARDADDATNDDATGDAEVRAFSIEYTTS